MLSNKKVCLLVVLVFSWLAVRVDAHDVAVHATTEAEGPKIIEQQAFFKELGNLLQDQEFSALMQAEKRGVRFEEDEDGQLPPKRPVGFCEGYIEKYYPKVFVIRDRFFLMMKPEQITQALRDIVDVFTERPWFYFVDDQTKFNLVLYWEHIVDQCAFINQFLKRSRVDIDSGEVFFLEDDYEFYSSTSPFAHRNMRPLADSIKKIDETVMADFYALCFDYLIKLFNEGILLKDLRTVERYYRELEFVIDKLRASVYEVDYQEAMRTGKELICLLKKKLGRDDLQFIEDSYGDDDEAKRIAYEAHFLGA
ncbi:hypothetical protein K2W90_02960 [Candidatus Babeliales bacterium]|nr:hypothetical protein [Candidatus Babeliales bacterium]